MSAIIGHQCEGLQQGYCVVPSAKRFILLYSFLKRNLSKKVMVFFSSCNSVKFHSELLRYIHVDCFDIHGKQKQQRRTSTFFDFCKAEKGILLCTDVVARGLDIPAVECYFLLLVGVEYGMPAMIVLNPKQKEQMRKGFIAVKNFCTFR
ncbi:hypothetical protein ACSBR2_039573 [Camellia fascicularis]